MSWNRTTVRRVGIGIACFALLASTAAVDAAVVRQPYLQLETPTSMTIVWRTDNATDSRVRYGTVQGSLSQTATNASVVTNHIVTITGLSPATKYFYDVGSTSVVQAGGTVEHYFVTAPATGSSPSFRAWIVGDSGDGGSDQTAVRNSMLAYTGANRPSLMLHVGDIAYTSGTDDEFTNFHFNVYQDIIRHTVQWPTLGNHEGSSTTSGQPGTSTGPYYDAFVLPTAAEAGGTASGTEAYYSFDYGNAHFISLNSYQVSRSPSGPMATWLQNDLAATNAQWVIAYWHHPPYSHGTHNSDVDTELREMRQNILPILEAGGVDLVLSGHSHDYERSYLIDGTYSTPTPDFATLQATGHIVDDGNGKPTGDGAYQKGAGRNAHQGAVYVVAGHGGASTGGSLSHPVMYFSETIHGSCILDVTSNTLTLTNVRSSGVVSDNFQILKGPQTPKVVSANPAKSAVLPALTSIQVTFSSGVTGVDAGDLSVNGSPATTLSGASGGSVYTFGGFTAPGNGHVGVVLAAGGIADATNPGLQFTGNVWSYTIDTTPPRVATETPQRGHDVGALPSISVTFSKGVTGVTAADLLVNGQPATSLSGVAGSAGPYNFTGFPAPQVGLVNVSLAAGAIHDAQSQPFSGDSWAYVLRPHLMINEYLTSNNTTTQDEFGEFDDYVEIYNPSDASVDMGGMHLSDALDFPAQYTIPAGVTIPGRGHLIFWCDSQPNQGPLHTNFNLARAGEAIGLFDTDENGFAAIDSTSWVNAVTDQAVGRFPDGINGFVNMPATPGATNTIACTNASQCTALTGACNTGACVANRCVAQPANNGSLCDDGIACRGPDTCNNGVCDGGASNCTAGQVCNFVTGLCETPLADPLPVNVGATFRYFKGTAAPPAAWADVAFDDSAWLSGPSGFGYGTDCAAQHGTVLADMLNGYSSLYVRHLFRVDNPAAVQSMLLSMDYDDAFVAYINGHEVARNNVAGSPPLYTTLATADHECSSCNATCNAPETFPIDVLAADLVSGNNVLAIQGHNLTAGSSDFTLIPTLSATEGASCAVNPECDDGNPCTDDSCVAGACQHMADDTNTCSDGIACTNDACSSGTCVTTSACPVGRTCNLGTGTCDAVPVTVTFQQGVGGYTGTVDTFVNSNAAQQNTNNSAVTPLVIDGDPDIEQALVRFDNIFGSGSGQIPLGATIQSATLTVNVTNPSANGMDLHRMLQSWSAASTWNTLSGGITANGTEAVAAADASTTYNGTVPSLFAISVTSSVAAWSSGSTNLGWAFLPLGTDSIQFDSADVATSSLRPKLSVTYAYSPPCSVDADCTDNNLCNGIETCVATVCQPGTALNCDDGNACTSDSCSPATGCAHANNTNPCSDGNACTANDTCAAGACVPGPAANCDDANACTSDSCDTLTGCVHTNVAGACSDGSLCTTGDVCSSGVCTGTPVVCPGGQTCNAGTGTCQAGPQTVTFQEGVSGYAGTQDTYLAQAAPTTAEGALDNWRWDTEDPAPNAEFGLIRFDGIIGSGVGQIPSGSTISAATLTLEVTNGSVAPQGSINESTVDWAEATATWNNFGGDAGVQSDEYLASPQFTAPIAIGSAAIDVTASLQAWASGTRSNFGWVFRPNSNDGVQVDSAEFATAAVRPKLSVTYTAPVSGCTTSAQCDDANACNGLETCVAGTCQAGTALNCDDGNVCTTDSCVPATGCAHANNTVACSDGNACTTGDVCAGGTCVPGGATNCDDGNVCTNDSCVPATGCAHANNTLACNDGNLCTTGDVCAGGSCSGTAVSCPVGQACNPGTGSCQAATTQTLTFQDGVAGYAGTQDTYLAQAAPTTPEGALDNWRWDTENPAPNAEFGLIRFDGIIGPGVGQIPSGSTITSATLALEVTNGSVVPEGSVNESAVDWAEATATWNNFGGEAGVQSDEYLASPQYIAPIATGSVSVAVTASVQAWASGTRSNFGWVFRPNNTDGVQVDSAEFATVSLRPKLSVTFTAPAAGCSTNADCNDGIACTTDVCSASVCSNTSNCVGGQTCNHGTGLCESVPVTATFQQGVGGYTGTVDTYVNSNAAQQNANNSAVTPLVIDGDPDIEQGLVRFDNIFGSGAGQIPLGATIQSATLTVNVTNPSANGMALHRMLQSWSATSTWSSLSGGITANGTEAVATPDASTTYNGTVPALFDVTVTSSLAAWSSGSTNLGWAFLPLGTDSIQFDSADVATAGLRPKLTVVYLLNCSSNAQCDDGNACNGAETCVAGACQAGAPPNCDDGNVCTTDSCVPATGCAHANNTLLCNDGFACTSGDVCSGGLCAGTPISCDDGVACTADSCVEGSGCQHTTNCPGGATCNVTTGLCTAARMECTPSTIPAGSGSTAALTVVLKNLGGLAPVRGYQTQISIARTSGTGTVSVSCPGGVAIDDARPDYLFFGSSSDFPATNCGLKRAASSLLSGGVTVGGTPAYLAGYTLTTSADASAGSTFAISLDPSPGSSVVGTTGQALDFDRGPACTLTIAGCTTAADCNDGNPCTVDTCDLSLGCQHAAGNAGSVCRPAAGPCDQAETCNGSSSVCPADQAAPNGTSCNDGNLCTVGDTCQGGACAPGSPVTCNDGNPCTDESCNPLTGSCVIVNDDTNSCSDGNSCTTDSCSAGSCVHAASGACGITGNVRYYRDDAGAGTEPSTKPVPDVGIDRTQDAIADATTNASGAYTLPSLSGNVTLTTVPKYGSPRADDHNGAITSFDASLTARAAALLVTLSPNQRIAADVTGDGTVSAFDASFVARFAAQLIDHFDVATASGSDWKFLRCDAYAYPGDPGCGTASYNFTPITQAESGKDFYAILYGDVTGNWQPGSFLLSASEKIQPSPEEQDAIALRPAKAIAVVRAEGARPAEISIEGLAGTLGPGERRDVTISLSDADGILGLDLNLRYDPRRLAVTGVRTTGLAAGWGVAHGEAAGVHRITTYGVAPLSGSGALLIVTVEGRASTPTEAVLRLDGIANEGTIPLITRGRASGPRVEADSPTAP